MLLLGHSGAGKTCLLMRYAKKAFSDTFITTIGVDFCVKYHEREGARRKVLWWDTAGQERFRSISAQYIRGADGVAVVLDLCDRASFEDARRWAADVRAAGGARLALLANKCDRPRDEWAVAPQEVEALAREFGVGARLTSARTGEGVDAALDALVDDVLAHPATQPAAPRPVQLASRTTTEDRCARCH